MKYLMFFILYWTACSSKPVVYNLPSGAILTEEHPISGDTAVLVIPGGGYKTVSMPEGSENLDWLLTNHVRCFVLTYRIAPYPAALNDTKEAWTFLHASTNQLKKYGIMGASVGGHLAALTI